MRTLFPISILVIGLTCCQTKNVDQKIEADSNGQNILLQHDNKPIEFEKLTTKTVIVSVNDLIKQSNETIDEINAAQNSQTIQNTLFAFDGLLYELGDLQSKLVLISLTHADDSMRNAAFAGTDKLQNYFNDVYLNDKLYQSIKKYCNDNDTTLSASEKKFLTDAVVTFENNGMKLNVEERTKLSDLNKKMVTIGNQFDRNIAESKDSILFTAEQLKGIQQEQLKSWIKGDSYVVNVNGPNYRYVLEDATDVGTRKTMFMHYNNRAYPGNMQVLDSLLYYRNEAAKLLNFSSFASYSVSNKMARFPANVWAFENNLKDKLSPLVTDDVKTMTAFKKELSPFGPDTLYAWDFAYYHKKLLSKKYNLNTDEVKEYFEMNNTLKGMFTVYEQLFNIKVKETSNVSVWNNKVKAFELWKDGEKAGNFYLDLFPRQNKYTHFACFPISQYRKTAAREILPEAALVCNFSEGTASQPSLLKHSDVVTLFHEFGHLVHWLLCHPTIASQNAFACKGDFIEAPSQFLENWCWEYDALKLFARHYKTGSPLPLSLFNKMKNAQLVNAGSLNMIQVSLGITDFTYEDKYEETKSKGLLKISKEIYALRQLPYPEGSHFICAFWHLNGYAANYYGYLWSKVYAQDMFSIFKQKGVMDKATGIRYRKEILEKGASEPEIEIVENFLGRKSNSNAFLESLNINK